MSNFLEWAKDNVNINLDMVELNAKHEDLTIKSKIEDNKFETKIEKDGETVLNLKGSFDIKKNRRAIKNRVEKFVPKDILDNETPENIISYVNSQSNSCGKEFNSIKKAIDQKGNIDMEKFNDITDEKERQLLSTYLVAKGYIV